MDAPGITDPTEPWNFLDPHGNPLRFAYHKIKYDEEDLPTVGEAIPAVWSNRKADEFAYYALRRWIDHREIGGLAIFLLASIRCLPAVARSHEHGGDPNGDNMGIAIEAAFDEIYSWPNHDPGYTDGIDFFAEPTFLEPSKPSKHSNWLTYYYIRWNKRAARRAIKEEKIIRRKLTQRSDVDHAVYGSRTQKKQGRRKVLARGSSCDSWQQAFDREIESEIEYGLSDWLNGRETQSWFTDWLDANVDDPIEKEIIKVKQAAPWRTHSQIIEMVNTLRGTNLKHDKVSKCLRRVEDLLTQRLKNKFGFRPTNARKGNRASGVPPLEPVILGEYCEVPVGKMEAAAQYELDVDGYKIGPKVLQHPNRLPPNPRPWSPAKSA